MRSSMVSYFIALCVFGSVAGVFGSETACERAQWWATAACLLISLRWSLEQDRR